jgi:hypothetical protein
MAAMNQTGLLLAVAAAMFVAGCEDLSKNLEPPPPTNPFPSISPAIKEQLHGRDVQGLGTIAGARCVFQGRTADSVAPWRCRVSTTDGGWGYCLVRVAGDELSEVSCRRTRAAVPIKKPE